jgi:hypothetical protein
MEAWYSELSRMDEQSHATEERISYEPEIGKGILQLPR